MSYNPICHTDGPQCTYLNDNISNLFKDWHTPVTQALMQYTGLKDKNGVEIYEGDVVRYLECNNFFSKRACRAKVKSIEIDVALGCGLAPTYQGGPDGETWTEAVEVIGNIYENPELIKKQS